MAQTPNGVENKRIRKEVVRVFREEIQRRYRIETIRGNIPTLNGDLRGVEQSDLDRAKELFLTTIYPDIDDRLERDKSFESLIRMLKNPRKLARIIPTLPHIVLAYGTQFPQAMRIGLNSVIAFNLSTRLEDEMMQIVADMVHGSRTPVGENFQLDIDVYRKAYGRVPYAEARRMIQLAVWVMQAGLRSRIAQTAWHILDDVQSSLKYSNVSAEAAGHAPVYDEEVQAIEYGKRTLDRIIQSLGYFSPEKTARLVNVARAVELDYLDRMAGKTAANSN